ncbi:AraC family transcriptional regulator [Sphingobacterium sp. HJSM2_6]|uniref:AraC family transcriptional regulator n=1 Tax=Sphingobacterium sp. HJSM2_6 TaxID=3366264 RepID=UPI003BE35A5A
MEAIKNREVKHPIEFTVPASGTGSFYIQEDFREEFYSHYHRHKEVQISYIIKGKGSVVIGNLIQPFFEDEIYILKANDPHIFINEGVAGESIHAIHIFVALDKLRSFFELQELNPTRDFFKQLNSSKKLDQQFGEAIKGKFLNLQQTEGLGKLMKVIEIFEYLLQHESNLISLYSGLHETFFNDKVGVRINEVLRYTLDNFNKEIGIDEVAQLIHMTPSAFCKYFKKHTMKTYVTFLNEIRIEKACQLLINRSTENISEVAYLCGFNTVVHFNRVFKHILHSSPSEFIHKHSAVRN